jgi:signal transduction histidine kinase
VVPDDLTVPPASEEAIRLLVREAVVNALKHAAPTRVAIDVAALPGARVQIVVANDGRGFRFQGRLEHEAFVATGQGPVSLRERLVSVGGSLAIESGAGGSRLEMTVPI